jgi:hypothetical protein
MYREIKRLETFKDYPLCFLDARKLAKSGCYNLGGLKGIQCYFCKIVIRRWYPHDNVVVRHLKKSPKCPLLKCRKTCNKPINIGELNEMLANIESNNPYAACYMDIDE